MGLGMGRERVYAFSSINVVIKLHQHFMNHPHSQLQPPVAPQHPHQHVAHGDYREDPYFWLNDPKNPEVMDYLRAENEYAAAAMQHLDPLIDALRNEMYDRIIAFDTSVPIKYGRYEYFTKDQQQDNYESHWRRIIGMPTSEELLIDENALAAGQKYFELADFVVSPNQEMLGYAIDSTGDEIYTISMLRISDRQVLDQLTNTSSDFVWDRRSSSIYYTTLNAAHRPHRVYRHHLGTKQQDDELIFEEADEAFYVSISVSDSERFIQIELNSQITSEVHLLDGDQVHPQPRLVFARRQGVIYEVQDRGENLYVLTNDEAVNFRLTRTSLPQPDPTLQTDVIAHNTNVTLTDFQVFSQFIVIEERRDGLPAIRVLADDDKESYVVQNPAHIQELELHENWEFATKTCRLAGNSLTMPFSVYDLDLSTGKTTHLKTKPVGGNYDPTHYGTEKHLVTSHDGTQVPMYLVFNKQAVKTQPAPLLLCGYGAYGINSSLYFNYRRLSLLDRGIIVAVTQLRGGSEMGRNWYLDGKLENKKNTFHDFHACANHLLDAGITSAEQLAIIGGSAGGLVVGNFLNAESLRCRAAVALVPFVDVITTILNDSLPLSIIERDEWGDPNDAEMYDYIKSYSPYDNTFAKNYPALLITGGLNDPRVGYWEPAKWAAKIRQCKTDRNVLYLITEMDAGHAGSSGRSGELRETARNYAFIIDQLQVNHVPHLTDTQSDARPFENIRSD